MTDSPDELLAGVRRRHAPSVARVITLLESRRAGFEAMADLIWRDGGHARVVGITGAPGSGKSTLTNALVKNLRAQGRSVAVVAVDPSSTRAGGAILGDRIRMAELTPDPDVFVRSLSTRGSLGGVSRATVDAVAVLDAARFDDVVVETVGVGQAEIDIVSIAHVVVVVSVPGMGDDIQMMKAGLIEMADVHVVNKADRPGTHRTVAEIRSMLALALASQARNVAVVETSAVTGTGFDELRLAIDEHHRWLRDSGRLAECVRRGAEVRVREIAKELLMRSVQDPRRRTSFGSVVDDVVARRVSPYTAASQLLASGEHTSRLTEAAS